MEIFLQKLLGNNYRLNRIIAVVRSQEVYTSRILGADVKLNGFKNARK
jgi:hypothetical protein